MSNTGIIILAAGSSTRMGKLKQLMKYKNKTFLQHIITEAKNADLNPVICITGSQSDLVSASVSDLGVSVVYNQQWTGGMATGISAGIKQLMLSDVDSVILAVSDQPYVSSDLFRTIIRSQAESGKGIIACSYADTLGTPVLFVKHYFSHLQTLIGDEGAKKIVKANLSDVFQVEFDKGTVDIDTQQDYDNLMSDIN